MCVCCIRTAVTSLWEDGCRVFSRGARSVATVVYTSLCRWVGPEAALVCVVLPWVCCGRLLANSF